MLTYRDAVAWFYQFARFDPNAPRLPDDEKLLRMRELLDCLGNPFERFPSVLIAGTKGKGSSAALLASILRRAGYRVGLYTSPHLHTFRERIAVNGTLISKEDVVAGAARLMEMQKCVVGATFFEWVTALAFDYFAKQQVDIAVLEVGLGGRFDCTNVVTPLVSVITPISLDHMEILGSTLEAIAREKAGIIKPGIPVIVAPQPIEALEVLEQTALANNAPCIRVEHEWEWDLIECSPQRQLVRLRGGFLSGEITVELPLLGPHQRINLATVAATVAALKRHGIAVSPDAFQEGVRGVEWHVRFEVLEQEPWLVADGAHNRASARELVRTLDEVFPGSTMHLVFGASAEKDIEGMLSELLPRAASVVFARADHARAVTTQLLVNLASAYALPKLAAPTVADALASARARAALPGDVVCITGSLFIAAEARALILAQRGTPVETDDAE